MNGSGQPIPTGIHPGETLVYLVRHGQTTWNLERRMQGQLSVPLSEEGLKQAEAVAAWLAAQPVHFSALYSSDLRRAAQTAEAIADRLRLTPHYSSALRELHGGDCQGLTVAEIEAQHPGMLRHWGENVERFRLPGGESIPDVKQRMHAFYDSVVERHAGQAIVLVSHGAALAALQAAIHGWDLQETWHSKRARLGNTGVTVLSVQRTHGLCNILLTNSSEHLPTPTGLTSILDRQAM